MNIESIQSSRKVATSVLLFANCAALLLGADSAKLRPADTITTTVDIVVAPTTVQKHSGEFVTGLQVRDFEIYDNGKLQKITDDLRDSPFSLVVAVQRSADMEGMLPMVEKIGSVLTDLIVGASGEIAVVAFDHHVQLMQTFTNDGDEACQAMKRLKTGGYSHAVIDAVTESIRMLKDRPRERRRVVLVIGEKWDKGSTGSLREALTEAEFANVSIYSLNVSTAQAELTSRPQPQPPPLLPTTAYHVPAGAYLSPTAIDQNYYLGNWVPLFVNIFQEVADLTGDNTLEVFTRFTGGVEYSFDSNETLDVALQKFNQELHAQYLLSYSPNNLNEGGFHQIRVVVANHSKAKVRTRSGYWIAATTK